MKKIPGCPDLTREAAALIALIGSDKINDLGYPHVVLPVGAGAAIMFLLALGVNNISKNRPYPEFWV